MPKIKNTATRSRRAAAPKKPQPSQPREFQPGEDAQAFLHAKEVARNARLAATLDLKNLDDAERGFLAVCQTIYRRHSGGTGHTSPFEDFFSSLVFCVGEGRWPTPYSMDFSLRTFEANFEDMRRHSVLFLEAYPPAAATPEVTKPTAKPSKKAGRSRKARMEESHA